jgi:hypothetical protein
LARLGLGLHGARGPRLCRADLSLRVAARERTPEQSLLSGGASWHGWRRRYHGRGGARGGARAPMAERPPAGQVGGGGSSPELLADGKGGKTGTAAAFSNEVGAPVASGGARGSAHRKGWFHGGASEQQGNGDGRPEKRWGPPMRWPAGSRTSMGCWRRWQLGWKKADTAR